MSNKLVGTLSKGGSLKGNIVNYDGDSAYVVALKNGYKGTEEEWLESLRGDTGVYVGSGDMPENCNVQIDPNGYCFTAEDLNSKATLYEPIPDYMIPMGMTVGDVTGGRNVLVNSGISVERLNPTMKLIASGTTTEAVDAIDITDTTGGEIVDDMGNPAKRNFMLKNHICVRVSVPAVTTKANLWLKVNGGTNIGQIVSSTSTTEKTVSRFDAFYTGGGNWAYTGVAASNGTAVGNPWTCVGYTGQGEGIYHIRLHLASGKLPVGTTYQIYGIEV